MDTCLCHLNYYLLNISEWFFGNKFALLLATPNECQKLILLIINNLILTLDFEPNDIDTVIVRFEVNL